MIKNIYDCVKNSLITCLFYFMRVFRIQDNKIVFNSFYGKPFGDNGKYIALELLSRKNCNYDIVWLTRNCDDDSFPKEIRTVNFKSIRAIYELATAKVWVDNVRKASYVRKRKGQYYIQTWHGMTALKKVEEDAEDVLTKAYIKAAKKDSEMVDLFLAASAFDANLYENSFWYSGEIMSFGYPRHDILFQNESELKDKIKDKLGISSEKKVVMYAPTFRAKEDSNELSLFNIGWENLLEALSKKFGGEWIGMIRLHPNISRFGNQLAPSEGVINVTEYPDMQELLLISDCVISDYSSSIIEAAMIGKPCFVFALDISEYMKDRGLYFTFEELPFPLAESQDDLISEVLSFDENEYNHKIFDFFHNRYGLYDGGNASKKVCERIENIVAD